MQKAHIMGIAGTIALLSNLFLPGFAFGQIESGIQTGYITLNCGTLSITNVPGTNLTLNIIDPPSGGYRHSFAQFFNSSIPYQSGVAPLNPISGIYISDTRTDSPACVTNGSTEGFLLTATATNFVSGINVLPVLNNFYIGTTTNVESSLLPGYTLQGSANSSLFYSDQIPFAGPFNITSNIHLDNSSDLTSATTFTTLLNNNLQTLIGVTLLKNGTGSGTNDYKLVGTVVFPVFYLKIPESQTPGTYTSTITYTLSPAT